MIFDWANFEQHTHYLFGESIEPEWIAESPLGRVLSYRIDQPSAIGRMEYFEFARPLRAIVLDCAWRERRDLIIRDGDWIRFNFSLSIDIAMKLAEGKVVNVSAPSWRVINNPPDVEVVETMRANAKTVWVTICCKPDFLTAISGQTIENMPELFRTVFVGDSHDSFHEDFDFTSRLSAISADIIRTDLAGCARLAYVEARCIELICLALNEIMHSKSAAERVRLSNADEAALKKTYAILAEQFDNPPTIAALSRHVGLNRNKLFYGFKTLFACTISDFIQERRLEEGKRLLHETDLSVLEIANRVGFRHQCNFSTAIKRRFGSTPSQLREQDASS